MTKTAQKLDVTPLVEESFYAAATQAIRSEATKLLAGGNVAAVIGYQTGKRKGTAMPAIITSPEKAAELVFFPACVNNLALYLTKAKKEVRGKGRLAIVAKGCDMRALAGLITESQLKRDELVIIGVACAGVYASSADRNAPLTEGSIAGKCRECAVHLPEGADLLAGSLPQLPMLPPLEAQEL